MAVEILDLDIVPAPLGYQQGSSKEYDRLEDDLKLTGEAQNFGEGTRVENERVQKVVATGRSCSSIFRNEGGEKELELTVPSHNVLSTACVAPKPLIKFKFTSSVGANC